MLKISLFPNHSPIEILRDGELNQWQTPKEEYKGKTVKSLDELKKLILPDEMYGMVFLNEKRNSQDRNKFGSYDFIHKGFSRYSRPFKDAPGFSADVAYKCHDCNKIVIGPPILKTEDSMSGLAGRIGLDYVCSNCDVVMSEYIFEQS